MENSVFDFSLLKPFGKIALKGRYILAMAARPSLLVE